MSTGTNYLQFGRLVAVICPQCQHRTPVDEPYDSRGPWQCEACGYVWIFPAEMGWYKVSGDEWVRVP